MLEVEETDEVPVSVEPPLAADATPKGARADHVEAADPDLGSVPDLYASDAVSGRRGFDEFRVLAVIVASTLVIMALVWLTQPAAPTSSPPAEVSGSPAWTPALAREVSVPSASESTAAPALPDFRACTRSCAAAWTCTLDCVAGSLAKGFVGDVVAVRCQGAICREEIASCPGSCFDAWVDVNSCTGDGGDEIRCWSRHFSNVQ